MFGFGDFHQLPLRPEDLSTLQSISTRRWTPGTSASIANKRRISRVSL